MRVVRRAARRRRGFRRWAPASTTINSTMAVMITAEVEEEVVVEMMIESECVQKKDAFPTLS